MARRMQSRIWTSAAFSTIMRGSPLSLPSRTAGQIDEEKEMAAAMIGGAIGGTTGERTEEAEMETTGERGDEVRHRTISASCAAALDIGKKTHSKSLFKDTRKTGSHGCRKR